MSASVHIPREPRYRTERPVQMGSFTGVCRDLSASGLYFELDPAAQPGQVVSLSIDLDAMGRRMQWVMEAQVVRTVQTNGKLGIGARILKQHLVELDDDGLHA